MLYFCRFVVEEGVGNAWRLLMSSSGWPLVDSESGVDSRFGVVVYGSVALVFVFGGSGVCGKMRRFKGRRGEDDWKGDERAADGGEELIMALIYLGHCRGRAADTRCAPLHSSDAFK